LRCRWTSLSILLETRDAWYQKNGLQRASQSICELTPCLAPILNIDGTDFHVPQSMEEDPGIRLTRKEPSSFFDEDFSTFSNIVQNNDASFLENTSWDTYKEVEDEVDFPDTLLLGPWTEDMIRYLYWLVKSGARLEWLANNSGEVSSIFTPKLCSIAYTYRLLY